MEKTDADLVAVIKGGDREAFSLLYDRYIERIYRFVYYKTLSKDTAEDIVSSTFLKAFEKLESFDEKKGTFSQWLYAIARNSVIDHYRTARKVENIEDVVGLGEDTRKEEKLDAEETLKVIERYIKRLNPRQREIVILRVWEEMPYKEIADVVGGSEDAVKMMYSRTIHEIREKFGTLAPVVLFALLSGVTSQVLARTIGDIT
jgi:RNA polymerase sigma-70 factor, ECF subfamily